MDKQSKKNRDYGSSKQGSQVQKGSDTHRSQGKDCATKDCASQCRDSVEGNDCKD
ncbi:MAG TPA: hypothetical protein VHP31_07825 [Caproicibacter sp.]|nr:hypothetical protein [Caproicibacter sp.]